MFDRFAPSPVPKGRTPLETPYRRIDADDDDESTALLDSALFVAFGMGMGWISVPSLAVEAAQLELTQPEGLELTAMVGSASTLGNTMILPLFFSVQRRWALPANRWVQLALTGQATAMALGAAFCTSSVGGYSWALYVIALLGSLSASLHRLAGMPWVMEGHASLAYVSWFLAGGNLTGLLCAVLGMIQQPGGANRFSAHVYYLLLLCVVAAAVAAYCLLRPRRRPPVTAELMSPLPPKGDFASRLGVGVDVEPASATSPQGGSSWCRSLGLPAFASHPEVIKCTATNALVQTICWIVMGFTLPFAAARAMADAIDGGGHGPGTAGAVLLGYAAELSTIAVFLGSVASAWVRTDALHCGLAAGVMVVCLCAIIALIVDATPLAAGAGRAALLLGAATLARFVDGMVTPLLYRRAALPFAPSERRAVIQFASACAIATTVLGTWLTVTLLNAGVINK